MFRKLTKSSIFLYFLKSSSVRLILANQEAEKKGAPLFCLPAGEKLSNSSINELIKNTYLGISSTNLQDKNKMTVSQIALIGMQKQYACKKGEAKTTS